MTILEADGNEIGVGDASGLVYKLRTPECALATISQHPNNCIHRWHARFGHRDPSAIKKLLVNDLAEDIMIDNCPIKQICESCIRGKMSRCSFPKKSVSCTKEPMESIHTDLCELMSTETPEKRKYVMRLIDDYSRYTYIFLLRSKSQVTEVIKDFIQFSRTQFHES